MRTVQVDAGDQQNHVLYWRDAAPMAAGDLIGAARGFFTPHVVRQIARHRRLDLAGADRAIHAALPLLIAALSHVASEAQGARKLSRAVARQYPATLQTIRNGIGTESQDVAAAYGSGYMAHLAGGDVFAGITAQVACRSGVEASEARLLAGLVGWILMSHVRAEQRQTAMSASGLAALLDRNCRVLRDAPPAR